jgi:hypothetical protein
VRKDGFFARANFSCCGCCGHYELHGKLKEWNKTHKKQRKGYVFWHVQTEDVFSLNRGRWSGPDLSEGWHVYFGCLHEDGCTCAAQSLVEALKNNGVPYEWDGNHQSAVYIKFRNVEAIRRRERDEAKKKKLEAACTIDAM